MSNFQLCFSPSTYLQISVVYLIFLMCVEKIREPNEANCKLLYNNKIIFC